MDLGISGRKALVSGASSGIGLAIAGQLCREGVEVCLVARRAEELDRHARELTGSGFRAVTVSADVSTPEGIRAAFDGAVTQLGAIDILINNTGGPRPGVFDALPDEEWQRAVDLTLMSVVRMTRLALPGMIERRWGRIVNISSTSIRQPVEGLMLSNSIRMAVAGFAKTLTSEVSRHNITINTVAPGYTDTRRLQDLAATQAGAKKTSVAEIYEGWAADTPLGRVGTPSEVAAAAVFLASEPAAYINGVTLAVDGGRTRATL